MNTVELFIELARIPSPSLCEEKVSEFIIDYAKKQGIEAKYDNYKNVIIKIPPTNKNKKPLLLSSHMDVVGNSSEVNIRYTKDKKFLETDKTRTLGADDKTGVAVALKVAEYVASNKDLDHGGLEIVFTRDEETNMTGINHVEFNKLLSQDVLVLDSETLGNFEIAGAGYTKLNLTVTTKYGGHSGNDIQDKKRLNAAKLIADLVSKLPNGVYKKEKGFTITSCNLGSIVAGATDIGLERLLDEKEVQKPYSKSLIEKSADNVINTVAYAHWSLRSSDRKYEEELIQKFQDKIDAFNKKYGDLANAKLEVKIHMLPFEKSPEQDFQEIAKRAAKKINQKIKVQSFHAGAETHIYANKLNKNGKKFRPILLGVANIFSMHSENEQVEVSTIEKGYELTKQIFLEYNL